MSERLEKLEEIASLAAHAVTSDDSGELPYYLLGRKNFNRLIDLLIETEKISEAFGEGEKVDERTPVRREPESSKFSPPATAPGGYTFRYNYES